MCGTELQIMHHFSVKQRKIYHLRYLDQTLALSGCSLQHGTMLATIQIMWTKYVLHKPHSILN